MSRVNEFDAAVHSLGEHIVSHIGRDHLDEVLVAGDPLTLTAEVSIALSDQTWEEQSRAVEKMVELRGMFMSDLSFDYRFTYAGQAPSTASARAKQLAFC